MINTFDKKDFGWGSKILTPGPSNLTNGPILDHSAVVFDVAAGKMDLNVLWLAVIVKV